MLCSAPERCLQAGSNLVSAIRTRPLLSEVQHTQDATCVCLDEISTSGMRWICGCSKFVSECSGKGCSSSRLGASTTGAVARFGPRGRRGEGRSRTLFREMDAIKRAPRRKQNHRCAAGPSAPDIGPIKAAQPVLTDSLLNDLWLTEAPLWGSAKANSYPTPTRELRSTTASLPSRGVMRGVCPWFLDD